MYQLNKIYIDLHISNVRYHKPNKYTLLELMQSTAGRSFISLRRHVSHRVRPNYLEYIPANLLITRKSRQSPKDYREHRLTFHQQISIHPVGQIQYQGFLFMTVAPCTRLVQIMAERQKDREVAAVANASRANCQLSSSTT